MTKTVKFRFYLFLAFIIGIIPAVIFIHIVAQDIGIYFHISDSLLRFKSYSFSEMSTPAGMVIVSRPPLLPLLFATSISIFGRNLFAIYLPILLIRILIIPTAFLVARFFLRDQLAFLASSLLIFFPKLQLFVLSDFEADSLVLLLLLGVIYFYYYIKRAKRPLGYLLCGICLAALFLSKETGQIASFGVILGILAETRLNIKKILNKKFALLIIPYITTVIAFCLFALSQTGTLHLTGLSHQQNLSFLPANLLSYLKTIILYTGLEELSFTAPLKALLINIFILSLIVIGFLYFLIKKELMLIFPALTVLIFIGTLPPGETSADIPGSFQLITILAFIMPFIAIFIFKGLDLLNNKFLPLIIGSRQNALRIVSKIICVLLVFKFVNNFFAKPHYLLEFENEYYINISTVLTNKTPLPYVNFFRDSKGHYMRYEPKGTRIYSFMKNAYRKDKIKLFTPLFKLLLVIPLSVAIILEFF
ncbi:MAG: glycosyltransferase family 39 protein [Candidatus Beckwithbacteria bacterium]